MTEKKPTPLTAPLGPDHGPVTLYGVPGSWAAGHHTGVDFPAPVGTPVMAVRPGRVIDAGETTWGSAYGLCVILQDHAGHRWMYAHLSDVDVAVGDTVLRGRRIGKVGLTGRTTGPHLHLEVRVSPYRYDIDARDPLKLMPLGNRWRSR